MRIKTCSKCGNKIISRGWKGTEVCENCGWKNHFFEYKKGLLKYLLPSFDELSIGMMSYSFFFLLIINDTFKNELFELFFHRPDPRAIVAIVMYGAGAILSIYHIFSPRKKTGFEKLTMLFFVSFVNLIMGLYLTFYALEHMENFSIIFIIWNFVNGFSLIFLLRAKIIDESAVSDWNSPIPLAIFGIFIATIIVIICQYYYALYWAFTLSITISYCTTINSFIIRILQYFPKINSM